MTDAHLLDFGAPLSGTQERVGDAIFGKGVSLILVEFKRSSAELSSEKDKFSSYGEACAALGKMDGHHFLIFGQKSEESLSLRGQTYFSGTRAAKFNEVIGRGVAEPTFKNYLRQLLEFRNKDGRSGSNEQVEVSEYAAVMGVKNGKIVTACSMQSYIKEASLGADSSIDAGNAMSEQPRSKSSPKI